MTSSLAAGAAADVAGRLLLAAIDHALDLKTWHSLVRERGLSDEDAIDLLVAFVAAA